MNNLTNLIQYWMSLKRSRVIHRVNTSDQSPAALSNKSEDIQDKNLDEYMDPQSSFHEAEGTAVSQSAVSASTHQFSLAELEVDPDISMNGTGEDNLDLFLQREEALQCILKVAKIEAEIVVNQFKIRQAKIQRRMQTERR